MGVDKGLLDTLNNQLLLLDRESGADAIAGDVIRAIAATLDMFAGDRSNAAILSHLIDLHDVMLDMRPRMANVISDIQLMIVELKRREMDPNALRERLPRLLEWKEERKRRAAARVAAIIEPDKPVLLHSYSGTIDTALQIAVERGEKPVVFVAEQEQVRTARIVRSLSDLSLEFRVISEYALSHVLGEIGIALFSALTLNADEELIVAPGSANLINLLGAADVPTYVVLTTNKWSYWTDDASTTWHEIRKKSIAGVGVSKDIFSHDWVGLDRVTALVTEDGVLPPSEARKAYAASRADFAEVEREIKQLRTARAASMAQVRLPDPG
ncbi:MAG: hypothetical protein KDA32_03625 [Phycisphaerales bacterium]|nr:hypothetical protein [Phycisphaerales bacterium]